MTPELRAATVLVPIGNWFASNPKVVAAVTSAIRDAERAAYERGLYAGFDAGFEASGEGWNGEYPEGTSETEYYRAERANWIDAILFSIDKPKETT
jgi:hypothetical protein